MKKILIIINKLLKLVWWIFATKLYSSFAYKSEKFMFIAVMRQFARKDNSQ